MVDWIRVSRPAGRRRNGCLRWRPVELRPSLRESEGFGIHRVTLQGPGTIIYLRAHPVLQSRISYLFRVR